ncbi:MAG: hypothetical protein J4N83_04500 [Chloroflexi bacterium]|nr:hypothetical protein [Chloroflexota bacterium]
MDQYRFRIKAGVAPEELTAGAAAILAGEQASTGQHGWTTVHQGPRTFRVTRAIRPPLLMRWARGVAGVLVKPIELFFRGLSGGPARRRGIQRYESKQYGFEDVTPHHMREGNQGAFEAIMKGPAAERDAGSTTVEYIAAGAHPVGAGAELIFEASGPDAAMLAQRVEATLDRASDGEVRRLARSRVSG